MLFVGGLQKICPTLGEKVLRCFFGVLQLQGHLAVAEKVVCCLLPSFSGHLEARPVSEGSVVSVPWLKSSVYLKPGEN